MDPSLGHLLRSCLSHGEGKLALHVMDKELCKRILIVPAYRETQNRETQGGNAMVCLHPRS